MTALENFFASALSNWRMDTLLRCRPGPRNATMNDCGYFSSVNNRPDPWKIAGIAASTPGQLNALRSPSGAGIRRNGARAA